MEIVTSWMEKGIELGREEGFKIGWQEGFQLGLKEGFKIGRQTAAIKLITRQLQRRFADFSQSQQEHIQGLSTERLEELWGVLFDFNSITDLKNWLARI